MLRHELQSARAQLVVVVRVTTLQPAAETGKLEFRQLGPERRPHISEREIRRRLAYGAARHARPGAKRTLAALKIDRIVEPRASGREISGADLGVETTAP